MILVTTSLWSLCSTRISYSFSPLGREALLLKGHTQCTKFSLLQNPKRSFTFIWNFIKWFKNKKLVIARSSTKAEYRAFVVTPSKILWLQWFLVDMGAPQSTNSFIHYDNWSSIRITHDNFVTSSPKTLR